MNTLVKIIVDDDGDVTNNPDWHLVDPSNKQGPAALCTQEFFGFGESSIKYETKTANRGGVTCPRCLEIIHTFKSIRL